MTDGDIVSLKEPNLIISEAYRILTTNILFSSLKSKLQTIIVTSASPGEGKTTIASNLSVAMAQIGKKVLLVDCNQRTPKLHEVFNIPNKRGLSNILLEELVYNQILNKSSQENLSIITSGNILADPSKLLSSDEIKNLINGAKGYFDYIILDAPHVMGIADTYLLSQYSDGCILVTALGKTKIDDVIKTKKYLIEVNTKIIGVVINQAYIL